MKVALINPDSLTRFPQPPLGLLAIAGVLRATHQDVAILDFNSIAPNKITVGNVDIVGFTATSLTYPEALKMSKKITQVPKVLGGVHATLFPEQALADGFDAVVVGEGDLSTYTMTTDWKGIIRSAELTDMDSLPILPYDLLDGYRYRASPIHSRHKPTMPMLTSRGCPWSCNFCSKAVFGSKYRAMSSRRVVEELQVLKSRGIREIAFYDDTFTVDRNRLLALCDEMAPLGLYWTCQARVNTVNGEILKAMRRAGCDVIAYGVESGSPDILKGINKHITLEQAEEAIRRTHEAGIRSLAYFMFGSPGETKETVEETIRFAIKLDPDYAQFSMCTPLPGSALYERRQFLSYTGPQTNGVCSLSLPYLATACSRAYLRFYGRPGHIFRELRSWSDAKVIASWWHVIRTAQRAAQ